MKPRAVPKGSFAWRLRQWRATAGVTQREAALRLQLAYWTLVSWEQGGRTPDRWKQRAVLAMLEKE